MAFPAPVGEFTHVSLVSACLLTPSGRSKSRMLPIIPVKSVEKEGGPIANDFCYRDFARGEDKLALQRPSSAQHGDQKTIKHKGGTQLEQPHPL